jgi:hypothetical protein
MRIRNMKMLLTVGVLLPSALAATAAFPTARSPATFIDATRRDSIRDIAGAESSI